MNQPTKEVAAADLAPHMVYVRDDGEHMFVVEAGENADGDEPGGPTCFVSARSLLSAEAEQHHAASRREMFRVVEPTAIRDADDRLDDRIRRTTEVLAGLSASDPARHEHERQLAEDRAQRAWLAEQAPRCGVRLRAS